MERGLRLKDVYWSMDEMLSIWNNELQDQILESLTLEDEEIILKVNGRTYIVSDEGQSCCEHRYITTDDDLPSYTGAMLLALVQTEGRTTEVEPGWGDLHERSFLRLYTSNGVCVFETHNEHNGYYGGFCVRLNRR